MPGKNWSQRVSSGICLNIDRNDIDQVFFSLLALAKARWACDHPLRSLNCGDSFKTIDCRKRQERKILACRRSATDNCDQRTVTVTDVVDVGIRIAHHQRWPTFGYRRLDTEIHTESVTSYCNSSSCSVLGRQLWRSARAPPTWPSRSTRATSSGDSCSKLQQ